MQIRHPTTEAARALLARLTKNPAAFLRMFSSLAKIGFAFRPSAVYNLLAKIPRPAYLVCWASLMLIASFLPQGSPVARAFTLNGRQFITHLIAYGVLSWLVFWSLNGRSPRSRAIAMLLGPVLFGGLVEIMQPLVGRDSGWQDMLANGIGIGIAFVAVAAYSMLRKKAAPLV